MPTRSRSSSSSRRRSHVLVLFSFLQYLAAVVAVENLDELLLAATHTPPPPDSFLLVLRSHMPQQVSLNCKTQTPAGSDDYFYSFSLKTREARRKYFSLQSDENLSDGYTVSCYYAYQGNFAADVVIFDSRQPDADQCRVKNDGCRILIEADSVLYNITRSGGKQVIGDLPAKQCKWFLFIAYDCQQKQHSHPFAGRVINRWQWWTNI